MIAYVLYLLEFIDSKEGLRTVSKLMIIPSFLFFQVFWGDSAQLTRYEKIVPYVILDTFMLGTIYFMLLGLFMLAALLLEIYFRVYNEKNSKQVP